MTERFIAQQSSRTHGSTVPARILRLDIGAATSAGGRPFNEDRVEAQRTSFGALAIVADGVGGGEIGGRMSDQAVQMARESLCERSGAEPRRRLEQAFQLANQALLNLIRINPERFGRSGSTMVCAYVQQSGQATTAHIGAIGDSRVYLLAADGSLRQLNRDHTYFEQLCAAGMPESQARSHPHARKLTHVLGTDIGIVQVPNFYHSQVLAPGEVVLLCSDGVSGVVGTDEMKPILARYPAQRAADKLVALALKKKTTDNASAVVVRHGPASRNLPQHLLAFAGVALALIFAVWLGWMYLLPIASLGAPQSEPTAGAQTPAQAPITATLPLAPPTLPALKSGASAVSSWGIVPTSTPRPTTTPTATSTPTATPRPTRVPIRPTRIPVLPQPSVPPVEGATAEAPVEGATAEVPVEGATAEAR